MRKGRSCCAKALCKEEGLGRMTRRLWRALEGEGRRGEEGGQELQTWRGACEP